MAKAELKTKPNESSVEKFLARVSPEQKRKDCLQILKMLQKATKEQPKMWGSAIIGFGSYRYKYESGREGDWFIAGFSPRKQNITIYLMSGLAAHRDHLARLGKHTTGQSCLYLSGLDGIDITVLEKMFKESVQICRARNR